MAEPKKRSSKSRKNKRRINHSLKPIKVKKCKNCGAFIKPHTICAKCGTYNK